MRDADAEGVEGMSASKMRKAVADDDFESFRKELQKILMMVIPEHCLMQSARAWA